MDWTRKTKPVTASGVIRFSSRSCTIFKAARFRVALVQLCPAARRRGLARSALKTGSWFRSCHANQGGQNEEKNHEDYHRRFTD